MGDGCGGNAHGCFCDALHFFFNILLCFFDDLSVGPVAGRNIAHIERVSVNFAATLLDSSDIKGEVMDFLLVVFHDVSFVVVAHISLIGRIVKNFRGT